MDAAAAFARRFRQPFLAAADLRHFLACGLRYGTMPFGFRRRRFVVFFRVVLRLVLGIALPFFFGFVLLVLFFFGLRLGVSRWTENDPYGFRIELDFRDADLRLALGVHAFLREARGLRSRGFT